MTRRNSYLLYATFLIASTAPALAATDDTDALSLEGAQDLAQRPEEQGFRVFGEGASGRIHQRYGLGDLNSHRLSIDLSWNQRTSDRWRIGFSDRLDNIHPSNGDTPFTQNSLREAYASWQDEPGHHLFDFGRINVRYGPGYGFNPTDYFRENALRAVTTADPFALRENRLGTVMARYQRLWTGGGVSVALAPKLADAPSRDSFSLDLGATNSHNRGIATWSAAISDRMSTQLLAYGEQGKGSQLGVSVTALLSTAAVGHAEFSRGRDDDLFSATVTGPARQITRNRVSAGGTYTIASSGLALTAEYEYNGFAPDKASWDAGLGAGFNAYANYLLAVQARQDIAARTAWLLYASQKSAFLKKLDLTALLRINAQDHSQFAWLEIRYHWPSFDAALQWQSSIGGPTTENGLIPYRQTLQLLGTWYF